MKSLITVPPPLDKETHDKQTLKDVFNLATTQIELSK